jgi:Mg2+-importing ATPase
MTDLPEMTISTDNVDVEVVEKPRQWDIKFIRKFMIVFGLLSTIFDYITFGTLFFVFHSVMSQFRTAWFMESVISASMVVLVIRTRKPSLKSRPRKYLLLASLFIVGVTIVLPFTSLGQVFGFVILPTLYLLTVGIIVLLYIITAESVKKIFYKKIKF